MAPGITSSRNHPTKMPALERRTSFPTTELLYGELSPVHSERDGNHLHSNFFRHHYDGCAQLDDLMSNYLDHSWIRNSCAQGDKHRNQAQLSIIDVSKIPTVVIDNAHLNSGKRCRHSFDAESCQKFNELEKNSLCHQDDANVCESPNPSGQENVVCYLWEVANQNSYLKERQKYRLNIIPDGNCLYRAVSRAAYGKQSMHKELREQTIHHIADHLGEFNSIIEGDVGEFLITASQEGVWAGYPELLALSRLLNVNIYLTTGGSFESPTVSTMVHFLGEEDASKPIIWLSWLSNGHYDVVLNRSVPNLEYDEWYHANFKQA